MIYFPRIIRRYQDAKIILIHLCCWIFEVLCPLIRSDFGSSPIPWSIKYLTMISRLLLMKHSGFTWSNTFDLDSHSNIWRANFGASLWLSYVFSSWLTVVSHHMASFNAFQMHLWRMPQWLNWPWGNNTGSSRSECAFHLNNPKIPWCLSRIDKLTMRSRVYYWETAVSLSQ